MATAYCVRCKEKVEIKDEEKTKSSKGTPMTKGVCGKCGCKVCRMGG